MKPRRDEAEWPTPINSVRGRLTDGMSNLSRLDQTARAQAFAGLKTQQPELANLVGRMAKRFGKLELYVDSQTAKALGVRS